MQRLDGLFSPQILRWRAKSAFAVYFEEAGRDIRTVQELLGHSNVKTTMIYAHVLNRGGLGVRSPLEGL